MSVRIWLTSQGHSAISYLIQEGRWQGNLSIKKHEATGKSYVRLNVGLVDPTEEMPLIPQKYVERVTFKGVVNSLSGSHFSAGSYHSADMKTHMLIRSTHPSYEVSVSAPSVAEVQEIIYRLSISGGDEWVKLISRDDYRVEDERKKYGCFRSFVSAKTAS